jgi:hypothetical protein
MIPDKSAHTRVNLHRMKHAKVLSNRLEGGTVEGRRTEGRVMLHSRHITAAHNVQIRPTATTTSPRWGEVHIPYRVG